MVRYLRLYLYFLRFSFSRAMEFRLDFFFRVFMDVLYYAVNIAFYRVVFLHTDVLGGWTMDQMMVFIAGFLVIDAISMTVFANNLWMLPQYINRGDLDYYLVRPVSSIFFLSLRDFAADSFVNLVMAVGILGWSLVRYAGPLPAARVVLFVVMILMGALLRYFVRMMFLIPTFWAHSGRGFEMVFFHLNRFIERPDRIFTGVVRVVLTSVLPFSLMASFPARILLESLDITVLLHFFAVFAVFGLLVAAMWRLGLRGYSSASS
jgi:ABC-2 type transport system permease protein